MGESRERMRERRRGIGEGGERGWGRERMRERRREREGGWESAERR